MDEVPPFDHFHLHDDQQQGSQEKNKYVTAGHGEDLPQEYPDLPVLLRHDQRPLLLRATVTMSLEHHFEEGENAWSECFPETCVQAFSLSLREPHQRAA